LNFPPSLKYLDCNQSYYTSVSLKSWTKIFQTKKLHIWWLVMIG
jgi:hypothetical protein